MQTKGVSRQVSVQLDEVDEFVPEAQGKVKTGSEEQAIDLPALDPETGEPIKEIVPASGVPIEATVEEETRA